MPDTLMAVAEAQTTPGWFHHGAKILELVEQHRPTVCVELGTWLGASAIPVARSIRRWRGTLTCVDTWAGDVNEAHATSPWMLVSCARNFVNAGVSANVRLIPSTTIEAAQCWREPIDYLYIDADHAYESVLADLEAWMPHVKPGGLIVGDDYDNDLYPGVKAAWDDFEQRHGLTLTRFQSDPPHPHRIQLIYGTVPEASWA